jgi:ankyrin repeat protein
MLFQLIFDYLISVLIHYASKFGWYRSLETLIDSKANIDLKKTDSGKTALHNAAISGRFECLKLLIDKKVIKLNL